MDDVILTTTPSLPDREVKRIVGIVTAITVRTRGVGGKIIAGIESIFGGRGRAYLEEIEKARQEVLEQLKNKARSVGANAVVGIDFETSEILEGFIVISATGTAVVV